MPRVHPVARAQIAIARAALPVLRHRVKLAVDWEYRYRAEMEQLRQAATEREIPIVLLERA